MSELKDDKRFANTLARGLNVLRAFGPNDDGLGNLEISERTGLPRSTVSRLTFTLCALGYLTHGHHHDKYRLGPAALALGNIAGASFGFVETAGPIMQRLADATKTLTGVAIQDDGKMLIVKTWRPRNSTTIWLNVGYRMPILASSTGAAFLGALGRSELAKLTQSMAPQDQGQYQEAWAEAQADLLSDGYAFVRGEQRFNRSINAIAAPYRPSEFGEPVAFLSGARTVDLTDDLITESVGPALVTAVQELLHITGRRFPIHSED
ncbi:IclR family transcriptional regulator [Pseudophaeobacter flagellatus]|uniref:IclR family transcriptional regulator n=1 Tax=Pseudophaeobacter flagellatus TaxID=2899119 RepID=UPI001E460DC3|nr:IclR family transcriptional regulator [Pseudophaeobacter flagellatus]MCD9149700.1 IclR family transcriptional regulator [Pseudophaeobacter flagellatus]